MTNSQLPPPGWYPDPEGGPHPRWWNGVDWTDSLQLPYSTTAVIMVAPAGTPAYSLWIWLVVLLPYASLPLFLTMDPSSFFDPQALLAGGGTGTAEFAYLTSHVYWISAAVGWVASAATVLIAYLDWRWLASKGVPAPFHWAWSFFNLAGYPVYAIGRAVVTKRRTGSGSAVLWVTIGMLVLSIVAAVAWVLSEIFAVMPEMIRLGA